MGWHLGPTFFRDPKVLDSREDRFHYKMGRLGVYRPANPAQPLNPAERYTPKVSKKRVMENVRTKTVASLPEVKFIDPKTPQPNSKTQLKTKIDKNKVTITQNKKSHPLEAIPSKFKFDPVTQSSGDQKSSSQNNSKMAGNNSPETINPIIGSGFGVIVNATPETRPNVYLEANPSNATNDNSRLSEEMWVAVMLKNPNFETAKRFFNSYRSGDVSSSVYFSTAKNLVFEPGDNQKQVGLYLLSLETSSLSFRALFDVLQRDNSLQPSIDLILTSYQSESGLLALLPILNGAQPEKLVLLALQQIEKALISISNSVDFSQTSSSSGKLNSRRGTTWERFGHASGFDIKSRVLSVITQLIKLGSFGGELLELAQSIELRIKDSRVVAAD